MRTADFDFALPEELIAQHPVPQRDHSRLLVFHRDSHQVEHRRFFELSEFLREGDVLVLNDSRVIPARLRGVNAKSGGEFEMLLLEQSGTNEWWAMVRPGKRARLGTCIRVLDGSKKPTGIDAQVTAINEEGHRVLRFAGTADIFDELVNYGEVPLPPYISRVENHKEDDRERYQTVYARHAGSVAAPTAGLHFSKPLLEKIRSHKVKICFVTLHVGLGTFAPVKAESISDHKMHSERYRLSESTTQTIRAAKHAGARIFAAGTTSLRVLESVAKQNRGELRSGEGQTDIFIHPPYDFRIVDCLLTNFHLPRSTLLMLVSAFAANNDVRGRERILAVYQEAIRQKYRFFSYGDAMLIL